MKYTYVITFKIGGMLLPEDGNEVVINECDQLRVILCSDSSKYSFHSDRRMAIGTMMLKKGLGLTGQVGENEFEERLNAEIKLIQSDRNKKYFNGPFVVFEATGETAVDLSKPSKDVGSFVIAFDAVEKEPIEAHYKKLINKYLTSLFLISKQDFSVNKVFDGFYLEENSKIYYSIGFSMSGSMTVSSIFTDESSEKLKKFLPALNKTTDLNNVYRLLVQASSEQNDRLRSFISAWNALEKFFNKTFKPYNQRLLEKYTVDNSLALPKNLFLNPDKVMQGKYTIRDKFTVITSMLSDDAEKDLDTFVKAKKIRDTFSHGEDIDEVLLPINEVIKIVHKYLALHLLEI